MKIKVSKDVKKRFAEIFLNIYHQGNFDNWDRCIFKQQYKGVKLDFDL